MLQLVGLCGDIGAGKSTVAKIMREHGFQTSRFAAYIKDTAKLWGFTPEEIDGPLKEIPCERMLGVTPRHVLRILGTEVGRNIHPDFWVNLWQLNTAMPILESAGSLVVDDVRFPNEVAAIHRLGGKVFKVMRPGTEVNMSNHASDTQVLDYDYIIANTGDSVALKAHVAERLELVDTHLETAP